ncbi:12051_t:CDS:2, partial [Acaulospora colombiana]
EDFDSLVSPWYPESPELELKAEELKTLFRVSEDERANFLHARIMIVLISQPPESGTEASFHYTWDSNISQIIKTIISNGSPIRDNNRDTNTALKRPDYGFLVKKYCLFRGEEKAPDSSDDPKKELRVKLVDFSYQPLKYILGYYAFGPNVNYVAITNMGGRITTEPLFAHGLRFKAERLANIIHLIRLCSALSWMSEQLEPRINPEFTAIERY